MATPVTRIEQLFRVLKDGRAYRASVLARKAGHRFGASVYELRQMGCDIKSWLDVKAGEWKYQMLYYPYNLS